MAKKRKRAEPPPEPEVATLYVEIPRRLKDLIEESARRNHRKITGEVIMILEEHFSRNSPRQES